MDKQMSKWRIFLWLWLFFPYGIYLIIQQQKNKPQSVTDNQTNDAKSGSGDISIGAQEETSEVTDSNDVSPKLIDELSKTPKIDAENNSSGIRSRAKKTNQQKKLDENPKNTKVGKDPYKAWVNKKKNEERRKREKKRLMGVHGVSENIVNQLFKRWKNLSSIKSAPVEKLTQFNGISEKIANDIKNL